MEEYESLKYWELKKIAVDIGIVVDNLSFRGIEDDPRIEVARQKLIQQIKSHPKTKHMKDEFIKLQKKIEEIESLKTTPAWGAQFKLWENLTRKIIEEQFGKEALEIFDSQSTVVLTDEAYRDELDERKKLLQGFIANSDDYKPAPTPLSQSHLTSRSSSINWAMWGVVVAVIAIAVGVWATWYFSKPSVEQTNNLLDSINTVGQNGGNNTVNNTVIVNQTASQIVKATQVGENVEIDLSQLEHKYSTILYIAMNGQVLASPESWINNNGIVTMFNASTESQYLVQYTY